VIVSENTFLLAVLWIWPTRPVNHSLTSLAKGADFTTRYVSDP
jgi:hypothetical protein